MKRRSRIGFLSLSALLLAGALLSAGPAAAGNKLPFTAGAGLGLAESAANTWAEDAQLVYVENDEPLGAGAVAQRWGYLFYSKSLGKARSYSIRDGKIVTAADLGFEFDAPPIAEEWIDSGSALAAADEDAGNEYRSRYQGELSTMLLVRGVLHQDDPDATTWTVVYTSPHAAALYVVVDAGSNHVVRKWRG